MVYQIKLKIFEGPLDLLLHLVRKNKIDIFAIPIAEVADQYYEYLKLMQVLDLDIAGEFLVYAATLMYLKSRNLLPQEEKTPEEVAEEEQELEELREKLREYEKYKKAAMELSHREEEEMDRFVRELPPDQRQGEFAEGFEAGIFDLLDAFSSIVKGNIKKEVLEISEEGITVSEKINHIVEILKNCGKLLFTTLFFRAKTKMEMVVTFLAILELIRLRQIRAWQKRPFGKIWIQMNLDNSLLSRSRHPSEGVNPVGDNTENFPG